MENDELTTPQLIKHIQLAINPKFKNWILFKHGTYIILEETSDEKEIEAQGLELIKRYGPVFAGGSAGDFGTTKLNQTEGWVVSCHCYGMYTYVHPSELDEKSPGELEIGLYGRSKRDKDGLQPKIVCISSNGRIIKQ